MKHNISIAIKKELLPNWPRKKTQLALFGVHPQHPKKKHPQKNYPKRTDKLNDSHLPSPSPGWKPWRYPHNSTPIVVYKPVTCTWHLGLVDGVPNGFRFSRIFCGFEKKSCFFEDKKTCYVWVTFGGHKVLLQKVFSIKKTSATNGPYKHDLKFKSAC